LARIVKTFGNAGDVGKKHRWLVIESNLRVKRSDP
jgi:hypothetical protein